jgi:hypothetical protein
VLTKNEYLLLNHIKDSNQYIEDLGLSTTELHNAFANTYGKGFWTYVRSLNQPDHSVFLCNSPARFGDFSMQIVMWCKLTPQGLEAVENYTPEDR